MRRGRAAGVRRVRETGGVSEPVLHLIPLERWRSEPDMPVVPSSLDHEGFVHASPDAGTLLAVADAFYRDADQPMVALLIDPDRLSAPLRWEEAHGAPPPGVSGEVRFPHIYGPVERSAVVGVRYLRRDPAGRHVALEERTGTAEALDLLPHPEGGWYRETWRAPAEFEPDGYPGRRASATAIYFALAPGERSRWHAVRSDELWLWHSGGPLTLLLGGDGERPAERPDRVVLGTGLAAGQRPQALVPGGVWQAAEAGDAETLVSCVVSPGFDFADFRAE
ncbi:hypothetical protein CLV72_104426 [Allonocardiopsis opalescens]|uniref:DUF985 domain-containing protein n=1 Tax=Allonocardiopsis opalescens TaxID=1144618 RepID=A0A2T0Q4W3_9ACTN|nr:hypothetical protein CLV72_104426 [Allonocardiopsis opalescens]